MKEIFIVVVAIVQLLWHQATGANILMAHPATNFYVASHVRFQAVLSRELVKRGHRVVALSNSILKNLGNSDENYSEMININLTLSDEQEFIDRHERMYDLVNKPGVTIGEICEFSHRTVFYCQLLWKDTKTLERLKQERFDLMLINPFQQCEFLLHCYLDVPFVVFTPAMKYPAFNEDIFRVPSPMAYAPAMMTGFTDQMSFLERTINFLARTVGTSYISYLMIDQFAELKNELGLCPGMSLVDINRKAELWLANNDAVLDFPQPSVPNKVNIGGIMAEPAKPLPPVGMPWSFYS